MTANVWLVRSPEVDKQKFLNVFHLLNSIKGYFIFKTLEIEKEEEDEEHSNNNTTGFPKKTWDEFFLIADSFRKAQDLGNEEYVVVLTDIGNKDNWFSGADYDGRKKNLFVHCDDWEYFSRGSDVRYPISYHIAITLLHHTWFKSKEDLEAKVHETSTSNPVPEGCINDFCGNKNQVHLKMRTGDICDTCLQNLIDEEVDNNMIKHVLDIIGEISGLMRFSIKWKIDVRLPVLTIEGKKRNFQFKEFGNLKLNPIKASLQARILFQIIYQSQNSRNPLTLNDFLFGGRIKEKFIEAYLSAKDYSWEDEELRPNEYRKVIESIESLCDSKDEGITRLISKLNSAFEEALGADAAVNFKIQRVERLDQNDALKKHVYIIGKDPDKLKLDYIKIN